MDVPSHAEVVEQIDSFLSRHDMAPSRFGRDALGEPQFVLQVRKGRRPGLSTLRTLLAFMRARDEQLQDADMVGSRSAGAAASHRLNAGAR